MTANSRFSRTIVAAAIVVAGSYALPIFAAGNIRQQVLQGEHDYTYGILHRNVKLLDQVFADDFLDTGANGALHNKQQLLAAIVKNPAPTSITESHRIIHIYNDSSAVVSVEFVAKGMDAGKPYTYRGRATDVWALINGHWRCVAAHSSEIK